MKKERTYTEAFKKLQKLVDELETGDIQLDKLTLKVSQAGDLLAICEAKLRSIAQDVALSSHHDEPVLKKRKKTEQ